MSHKRARTSCENDVHSQDSSFVTYGTPLPLDSDSRDDGSYVPVWKQEVTDERGRKRLHGAFTGGFSAGYFNTVGSKEGWTPSTFVSSRTNRRKDNDKNGQQRPEDFMDEEDLAEAAEAQKLQTTETFSGLGSTGEDEKRTGFLIDLLRTEGETMGVKLLRKMGWRDGQGIGARVRRKAQLADGQDGNDNDEAAEEHLFAPANSAMVTFARKNDRKGIGYAGEAPLASVSSEKEREPASDEDEDTGQAFTASVAKKGQQPALKAKNKPNGIGVGILNDLGSDEDDPYEIGPRISYNRVIGGDKKKGKSKAAKSKSSTQAANPLLGAKPVFMSKKALPSGFRKCHDGRLPLAGFVLIDSPEMTSSMAEDDRWPRLKVPPGWKSSKIPTTSPTTADSSRYQSTADAARASQLDPKARATILGEAQLPGKSVFDFLSTAARDRIASASGKRNLPAALGEAPPANINDSLPNPFPKPKAPASNPRNTSTDIPDLDKDVALAALGRGIGGWTPYADDPAKLSRYRSFLEFRGGITSSLPPNHRPADLAPDAWLQELREFAHAAQVFRPMTGMMASRFTSSTTTPASSIRTTDTNTAEEDDEDKPILLHTPATAPAAAKPEDPAEAAAKMGLFGPLTRSVIPFYPTRLLCKRFGVKPPINVQPDSSGSGDVPSSTGGSGAGFGARNTGQPADLVSKTAMEQMMREAGVARNVGFGTASAKGGSAWDVGVGGVGGSGLRDVGGSAGVVEKMEEVKNTVTVDAERNEALEGQRAGDAVFRAIFGSDEEDE